MAIARPVSGSSPDVKLGAYTGPEGGSDQDDTVKASLDLAHTDLDTGLQYDQDFLGLLGLGTGNIFYVDNGTDGDAGTSWATAVGTLDEAVNLCTTGAGDSILVAAGHNEALTAADGVDVDKASITIIGLGTGSSKPTFDYDHANGEFVIGAAGVHIKNLRFRVSANATTKAIDVESAGDDFIIEDCEFGFAELATDEFSSAIIVGDTANGGVIRGCTFDAAGQAAVQAILMDADITSITIEDNVVRGDYSVACIKGDEQSDSVIIRNNLLMDGITGGASGLNDQPCIELHASTTALINDNTCITNVAIPELAIVVADAFLAGNTYSETEGVYGAREIGLVPGRTYAAKCSTTTAYAEDLFVVAGGPILITSFVGQVTTAIAAAGGSLHVWCDATTATQDILFSTAVAVDGDAVGTLWCFDLDDGQAVLNPEENAGGSTYGNWFCPIGTIEQSNTDADATGAIDWYMTFIPLVDGVTVTPQ